MKTELRDGERVWTKDSIEIILEGYQPHHSDGYWYKLGSVFRGGLKEAGFTEPGVPLKNKISLTLQTQDWFCPTHLLRLDDGHIIFLLNLEQRPARDLIYLWDFIRQSWTENGRELSKISPSDPNTIK